MDKARLYLNKCYSTQRIRSRNRYEESFKCIQQCKSYLRGDLGGIKALSGVVTILDRTQDVLCKKLGDHFVRLCLDEAEGDLEQQLTPVFYELLNLKWLLKAFELYRGKAEEQLKEVMSSVMTICLGKER